MKHDRTKAEMAFIDQKTRQLMSVWANVCVQTGKLPTDQFGVDSPNPYVQHAFAKGWLTKQEPRRLTSRGWQTAAAFLKR